MLKATIVITGNKEVLAGFQKLGQSFYMFKAAMDDIGIETSNYFSEVAFASQGGVFGASWPRLNTAYALRKAKRYPGRGPLIANGAMKSSFTHESTETSVTIGNTADYFKYHQSALPRSKMPLRQMMGVNNTVKNIVQIIIDKDINAKIRRAGL